MSDDLNAKAAPWVPVWHPSYHSIQAEQRALEEMERALDQLASPIGNPSGKVLPRGAMPIGKDGALSPLAAEFWFPECRDCTCCKGFKYGCTCREAGAIECQDISCCAVLREASGTQTYKQQYDEYDHEEYDEEELSREEELAMALMEEELTIEASTKYFAPSASSKAYVPAGAMPIGKDGGLSPLAAEFWFPECRDCTCCKGFKYGCTCREAGAMECQDVSCNTLNSTAPSAPKSTAHATVTSTSDRQCSFFLAGSCRFGESCRFTHTAALDTQPKPYAGKQAQKDMCRFDTRCAYRSSGCTYRHTPCTHFFGSSCDAGSECIFSHNPLDNY